MIKDAALKSTREGFGEGILQLGRKYQDVVVLTADLKDSTKVDRFAKEFPERFIEMGVAEQNLAGISAGMAISGMTPFMTSFAVFSPGRNWDQIRVSICYSQANVKIVGSHAGLSAGQDGATHQALEDIAITRVLPHLVVLQPADYNEALNMVEAAYLYKGPVYIRLGREQTTKITDIETEFVIGNGQILKEGRDVTLIGTGPILAEVLKAAEKLEKTGIEAEVINISSIKPLDAELVVKSVKKTRKAITIEEHQISGGLGGAIAELLSDRFPTNLLRIGVQDSFSESGTYSDLLVKYKLNSDGLFEQITHFLSK